MRISAISPTFKGASNVTKKQNVQNKTQNADSVSFKGADVYLHGSIEKSQLLKKLLEIMPNYNSKSYNKCVEMKDSILAVMKSYEHIADKLPKNLNIYLGAKKFGLFKPFDVCCTAGFKHHGVSVQTVEDLLALVIRNKDYFTTEERFLAAKRVITDALKPGAKKYLEQGFTSFVPLSKMLEEGYGRTTVISHFSPMNRYLPKDWWLSEFANKNRNPDAEMLNILNTIFSNNKLLPPEPKYHTYNPADYFLPY